MAQGIETVGVYVRDQDEALDFYVGKLGFRVHTDVRNGEYLLAINGVAALALLVLVGLQLRRLRRDFKGGVFGSRLKSRLTPPYGLAMEGYAVPVIDY